MPPHVLRKNHEIGHYSGYQTRVVAEYFYELTSRDDLDILGEIYRYAESEGLPFLIISGGTNLLFSKDYFPGVVIKNSLSGWHYDKEEKRLQASSDDSIWKIAASLEHDHANPLWHRFIGLPGSIGGAVYGNAGCFGLETESNFAHALIYDMLSGESKIIRKDEMDFSYRHSILKDHSEYFIIEAVFDLSKKIEKYHSDVDNIEFREQKQPKGNSCGSFWKNPSRDISAGYLIESVGMKGYRHGGARWSDIHANFLLSDGKGCKPSDLIELVEMTKAKIKTESQIELINEVRIIY